jgi:hypothetical protein
MLRSVCAYVVWTWLAASLLHGAAHLAAGAPLTPLPSSLFGIGVGVEVFFSLGPLVALVLLYTRWTRWGAFLLSLTLLIGLLWGFGGHFLFPSGDNVMMHATSPAAPAFLITSILVLIVPWAGVTVGIYTLVQTFRQQHRPSSTGANQPQREEESQTYARSRV